MKLVRTKQELRTLRRKWIFAGEKVAVVPTMGALHAGHLSLVEAAKQGGADRVIVTIFVNPPKQFNNPPDDLDKYPRTEDTDAAKLAPPYGGVDALYVPTPDQIYPQALPPTCRCPA